LLKSTFSSPILLILESLKIQKDSDLIEKLILQIEDWHYFFTLAHAHGVFPLVYKSLKNHGTLIPQNILIQMKKNNMMIVKQNMLMTSELLKIMKLLEEYNINAISFKGPLLSQLAYKDITFRQYSDLDILVDEEYIFTTTKLLTEKGYTHTHSIKLLKNKTFLQVSNDFSLFTTNNIHIELHWKLFREKIGLHKKFSDYFRTKTSVSIHGKEINSLSIELLLVYLCLHGSKHAWERIEWINDIAMLIHNNKIIWKNVLETAQIMNVETSLYLGLNLANDVCKIDMPKELLKKINSLYINNLKEDVYNFINQDLVLHQNHSTYKQIKAFQGKLLNSNSKKIKHFIFHYISLTQNDFLAFPLPSSLRWVLYIIKPFRIIYKTVLTKNLN